MSFENREDFRSIFATAKELLKAKGKIDLVILLSDAELTVSHSGYNNWNGGINFYSIAINVSVPLFVKLQSMNIKEVEEQILLAFQDATRSVNDEEFSQVLIAPKSRINTDWTLLISIPKIELKKKVEYLKNVMVAVSTGGQRIQEVENEYIKIYSEINNALRQVDIENPNPFKSLWDWYGKWKNDLPNYQTRRDYIRDLFDPLLSMFTETEKESIVDIKVNLTLLSKEIFSDMI